MTAYVSIIKVCPFWADAFTQLRLVGDSTYPFSRRSTPCTPARLAR